MNEPERDQRKRAERDAIDAKLLAALDSGEPIEMTKEWWKERHRELDRRIAERKTKS